MRKNWFVLSWILALGAVLMGCGQKKPEDMAEDTPWNHGYMAIMETEEGYYYNYSCQPYNFSRSKTDEDEFFVDMRPVDGCRLYYHEKESGVDILLCSKPECQHKGGDDCEATYRYVKTVNTAMYEGNLYILGLDVDQEKVSLNLYRGALDGSSMDKVGTVIQGENLRDENISNPSSMDGFILHKGYAYIPYYLRFGQSSKTFLGGGLCRMNLLTGEKEILYEMEYVSSGSPVMDAAIGDYVYYHLTSVQGGSGVYSKGYRYVISENRVEPLESYHADYPENKYHTCYVAFSEDRNYECVYTTDNRLILTPCDAKTGQKIPDRLIEVTMEQLDLWDKNFSVLCYDDKLMVANREKVVWYSREGDLLAEISIPFQGMGTDRGAYDEFLFRINMDKLYLLHRTSEKGYYKSYDVYCCELTELFSGEGEWQKAFVIPSKAEILWGIGS